MKNKKILFFILTFVALIMSMFSIDFNINASTVNTSNQIYIEGAQIRTSGMPGIRFVGSLKESYNKTNVSGFGIAVAFGAVDVDDIIIGETVNGKKVLNTETSGIDESNHYYISLISIPKDMYGQLVTARSYIIDKGEYIYSDSVMTRCLGGVAIEAQANGESSDLLDDIVSTISNNYKKMFTDSMGSVHFDNPIFESDYVNLSKVFLKDWNNLIGTNLDYKTAFIIDNYSSPFSDSAKLNYNLKTFFQNEKMSLKWGWMLDYIKIELTEAIGYSYVVKQINVIVNDVEDSENWYNGSHLISCILSIFNGKKTSCGYGGYEFEIDNSKKEKLGLIVNYNDTIYANFENSNLVLKGSNVVLPSIADQNDMKGIYVSGVNKYDPSVYFVVPNNNILLIKDYIEKEKQLYEITFDSDGGTSYDKLTVEYNQEITLPTDIKKNGYEFLGWYYNDTKLSNPFNYTYNDSITIKAKWEKVLVLENLTYDGSTVKYRNSSTIVQIPTEYVQHESQLRAAWVTSVVGNFSPSSNQTTMKKNLTAVLNLFEKYNLNCMIFHVRAMNDAYYKTKLAPINSSYGTYSTFETWDYLTWLIDECHSRGIEFHAWLNPYRIKSTGYSSNATEETVAANYVNYPSNPASDPDNILLTYRDDGRHGAILNPSKKVVQDYIVNVCLEIMQNYDVDAIHFDDYFYAQMSSGVTVLTEPDQDDYESYIDNNPSCGYSKTNATHKKQWRRDNINSFIQKLHIAMTEYNETNKKDVQLGIAPTGIYKNGNGVVTYDSNGTAITTGSNTGGQEHYSSYLFCDTKYWIDNEWIDYIMPQSYWGFTHPSAGYADVMDWWNKVVEYKDVNLYSGIGLYMSMESSNTYSWKTQSYELSNQILYTTKLKNVQGVSLYSYGSLKSIDASSSLIAYPGLQRLLNEYWISKVATPMTAASKYLD